MTTYDEKWISEAVLTHQRLTQSVVAIIRGLLIAKGITFLTVDGRVKDKDSIIKKIERKRYKNPARQMTDISGLRVIVYFESDIARVSEVIASCFRVDKKNSLDKGALLSVDKIGYRSVHFVCDIGESRERLPEFEGMAGMKFEIQVRTVLQHAWAEISHDRNYKFTGKLPAEIERELFLYSGLLEVADKGFDKLSKAIDKYSEEIKGREVDSLVDKPIDSISLVSFVESWCDKNDIPLRSSGSKSGYADLVQEIELCGIKTLSQLSEIIPDDYADKCKGAELAPTIYGHVRNWLLIHDWRKYSSKSRYTWGALTGMDVLKAYIPENEIDEFTTEFNAID